MFSVRGNGVVCGYSSSLQCPYNIWIRASHHPGASIFVILEVQVGFMDGDSALTLGAQNFPDLWRRFYLSRFLSACPLNWAVRVHGTRYVHPALSNGIVCLQEVEGTKWGHRSEGILLFLWAFFTCQYMTKAELQLYSNSPSLRNGRWLTSDYAFQIFAASCFVVHNYVVIPTVDWRWIDRRQCLVRLVAQATRCPDEFLQVVLTLMCRNAYTETEDVKSICFRGVFQGTF